MASESIPVRGVAAACVLCGNMLPGAPQNYFDTRFGSPGSYAIAACLQCGIEQTLPRPSPESLRHYYETYYNFSGESGTPYTRSRERFLNSPFYRLWIALDGDISFHSFRGAGDLLDYGCNEGRGLAIYQANGYRVEGLELNSKAASLARARGFTVWNEGLENWEAPHPYDVVVLSNVLEHALDPALMLRRIKRLLKPQGQVWISCPNSESWFRGLFGRSWINWHVPFHIVHFSQRTLQRLLETEGFRVLEARQATPSLWVAQSLIAACFARPGSPTKQLRSKLIVAPLMFLIRLFLFPALWIANGFRKGDCLLLRVTGARRMDAAQGEA